MHHICCFSRPRRHARGRTGAILILAMLTLLLLTTLTIGLFSLAQMDGIEASHAITNMQAYWAAEAGIEHAKTLGQLRRVPYEYYDRPSGSLTNFLWGTNVLRGTTACGSYTVDILSDPAWTNSLQALKKYIIKSHGTSLVGNTQTITLNAVIQNFASYVWATTYENDVSFRSGDILDGPLYSNDKLTLDGTGGNPIFKQMVTLATNTVVYNNGATINAFQGGLTLNAPKLDIIGSNSTDHILDVLIDAQRAGTNGLVLTNGSYKFVFQPGGKFVYQKGTISGLPATILTSGSIWTNTLAAISNIYVGGSAFVDGTVSGKVTLAAMDSIYITNNLVYQSATNPPPPWFVTNAFNANNVVDTLGLIASNQVQIISKTNIEIHAAIMITAGSTAPMGFNAYYYNRGLGSPYIKLYGGITQYHRGTVGQVGGNGYSKNYKFDTRFLTQAPPGFPYSVYVFSTWQQLAN